MNDVTDKSAWIVPRVLTGLGACVFSAFSLLILVNQWRSGFDWFVGGMIGSFVATIASLGWWFALRGQYAESRDRMKFPVLGGLILGGIGFVGGFFGPMIFMPNSNLGPLMAFGTGPVGFVAGAVLGAIVGIDRTQQQ